MRNVSKTFIKLGPLLAVLGLGLFCIAYAIKYDEQFCLAVGGAILGASLGSIFSFHDIRSM